jgi:DNA-binding NarL/FixJ family response regulator
MQSLKQASPAPHAEAASGERSSTRILLVDDHAPTREEMCSLIERQPDMDVIGQCGTGEEAVERTRKLAPDIVVMDIVLPGMTGVEAAGIIIREHPLTKIVALSNHSGRNLVQAVLDAGAMAYVRKDHAFEELVAAVRSISAGKRYLGRGVND